MKNLAIVLLNVMLVASAATNVYFGSELRRLRATYEELWQLNLTTGLERYWLRRGQLAQIDALAERCKQHGDSESEIDEILRAASSVRSA